MPDPMNIVTNETIPTFRANTQVNKQLQCTVTSAVAGC